jgi:superoxide dismutase, Cu-Zn family
MRIPRIHRMLAALTLMGLTVAVVPASAAAYDDSRGATATVRDVNGTSLGTVVLQSSGGKIVVAGRLSGLTAGFHGFHIHTTGLCDPIGGFATAGGHWNPGGDTHGNHTGDMPSVLLTTSGQSHAEFETDRFNVEDLFDADGSAVVLHAGPDNFANIPVNPYGGPVGATLNTGDAGGRYACGVVTR